YCDHIFKKYGVSKKEIPEISETTSKDEMCELLNKAKAAHAAVVQEENTQAKTEGRAPTPLDNPPLLNALEEIRSNLSGLDWANWVDAKIWSDHIKSIRPKFMYFDEYYELPGRIHINHIAHHPAKTEEEKTAKALLELADIDTDEVLSAHNFENFVAELEATSSEITQHIFKYWKNNSGLRVQFQVEPHATDKYLNIRVWNDKHHISLPLANRSKGFNWFFSFIVWFSRIQEDKNHDYILLLDEPGLNLHAVAQADLLRFIEDLCADYQVVYTTHSPFMVPPGKLERVRTIYEDKEGSEIKEAIQQKDADTLFPLQAALGYDIAQNLFINKKNLLVEGPSDLIYLTMMSSVLEGAGKKGLCEDITIVPVGGLDKVTSFISLLRGQKLSIVCLLDTFTDQKGKKRLEDLVMLKIIKDKDILFFDQFADLPGDVADLEDLFEKSEYLRFFNEAFNEHSDIQMKDIDDVDGPLLPQINRHIGKTRFNHYRPASCANSLGLDAGQFSDNTLRRFEAAIAEVNRRFA
ncbi:MAG: AAA family ATPase, partial [Lentisphaerae bacterium]|nr:AAA family ATPase [Lentisphaerota bacterium]